MATTGINAPSVPSSRPADRSQLKSQSDAFNNLQMEDFLKLMITQLQSQDPLNPMENAELLQQVSQMQSIQSTTKLNSTLDSVLLGQNLANASNLIGKTVVGLTAEGEQVSGPVDKATLIDNVPYLNVGDQQIPISNVKYILPEGTEVTPADSNDD